MIYKMPCSNTIFYSFTLLRDFFFFETFDNTNSLGILYFHYSSIKIQRDCFLNDIPRRTDIRHSHWL